ncbi:MAG: GSCFA domain-containing protein [Catalinimonas sp.]
MQPLRTELRVPTADFSIGPDDGILSVGSCFADRMGQRLADLKFPATVNPFGVIYHPLALHRLLRAAATGTPPTEAGYLHRDDCWVHRHFHSEHHADTRDELAVRLARTLRDVGRDLPTRRVLLLTWGTAWGYRRRADGELVANCHREPSADFEKVLTPVDAVVDDARRVLNALRRVSPELRVVLTVSPVRHVRDGLPENGVSKATLRLAAHTLAASLPGVHYFPSYELMVDDLRDYRFYGADLVHPTPTAEAYLWEQFDRVYLSEAARRFAADWTELRRALDHRPFRPEGEAHQRFLRKLLTRLESLAERMDVSAEVAAVRAQLRT